MLHPPPRRTALCDTRWRAPRVAGATVQYSGYCEKKRLVVEFPGPTVRHISGLGLLDNHQVNFLASLITAAAGATASSYIF